MKLNFIANRRGNQSRLRAVADFFFPYTQRIRFEAGTALQVSKDGTRKISREFGTFRAFAWHYLYAVTVFQWRNAVKQAQEFAAECGMPKELVFKLGAIALDVATNSLPRKANVSDWNYTHTVTGSNIVMAMGIIWWSNGGAVTRNNPTQNAVNLTVGSADAGPNYKRSTWYLASPATGTAQVTFSSGSYGSFGANTYSGANTASPVDANATGTNTSTAISTNITTNNANSALFDAVLSNAGMGGGPDGGQTTNWQEGAGNTGASSRKSATTAGVYAMGWSGFTSGTNNHAILAINELPGTTAKFFPFF